jgi:hypothetical protein
MMLFLSSIPIHGNRAHRLLDAIFFVSVDKPPLHLYR